MEGSYLCVWWRPDITAGPCQQLERKAWMWSGADPPRSCVRHSSPLTLTIWMPCSQLVSVSMTLYACLAWDSQQWKEAILQALLQQDGLGDQRQQVWATEALGAWHRPPIVIEAASLAALQSHPKFSGGQPSSGTIVGREFWESQLQLSWVDSGPRQHVLQEGWKLMVGAEFFGCRNELSSPWGRGTMSVLGDRQLEVSDLLSGWLLHQRKSGKSLESREP